MSSVAKVSAFAKRRRLNDGTTFANTDSDSSASIKSVQQSNTRRPHKQSQRGASHNESQPVRDDTRANGQVVQESLTENSFTALVDNDVVQFSASREIEPIDYDACKVRLSKGQICSVYGVAKLWVRSGTVKLFGAHINESTTVRTVFAPFERTTVRIEAVSEFAEFQIEGLAGAKVGTPSPVNIPGRPEHSTRRSDPSFEVAGQSVESESRSTLTAPQIEAYDLGLEVRNFVKSYLKTNGTGDKSLRILLCGTRPLKTAATSIALINGILSELRPNENLHSVGFLDLNPTSPAFSCPGTVSLACFRTFLLGPTHAYPLQVEDAAGNSLIKSFYVGVDPGGLIGHIDTSLLKRLLSAANKTNHKLLIIRVGEWFASMSEQSLMQLSNVLEPKMVLSVDQSRTSPCYLSTSLVAQLTSAHFIHQPYHTSNSISAGLQHKLSLQSHFLLYGYLGNSPLWHGKGNANQISRKVKLPFGTEQNGIKFVITHGGIIRLQDMTEALNKAMVMIVARDGGAEEVTSMPSTAVVCQSDSQHELYHVGIALVEEVDEIDKTISLNTPVTSARLAKLFLAGLNIGLVLSKPNADGWLHRGLLRE